MSKLYFARYQNKNDKMPNAYQKWYGRVVHFETLDLDGLCEHIASHGSIYTPDVVFGVVKKFVGCIQELMLEGKKVRLNGLGTFYIGCTSTGVNNADDYDVNKHITALHTKFIPDQSKFSKYKVKSLLASATMSNDLPTLIKEANIEDDGGGSTSGGGGTSGGSGESGSGEGGGTVYDEP